MRDFPGKVYDKTKQIPKGKVSTYKEIARALNSKAYQAVGQALRNNPHAPQVPCHRVVRSDLTIGGFQGILKGNNTSSKKELLRREGISMEGDKIPEEFLHRF